MQISIIIPAYNEEDRISDSIISIKEFLTKSSFDSEIIVVDDGSTDNTVSNCKALGVAVLEQKQNKGKGAAVRRGMLESSGDIKIFTDADLSTPIKEINTILPYFKKGYDVVIGSRALQNELIREHQPWYREAMGKIFNKIVQFLVIKGIRDTQCGFKAFTSEAALNIFSESKIDGFAFDVEALYLASKNNYSVKEVPVEWYNDERSKVDPIKDSIKMFFEIIKIKGLH
ncbi:glycosyltransferase family 2 protein [Candidatus Kapabacteria bacterium]|nr:glycosyltransferase family 2 protein [Candidatus Kapabacteria bacterium]